MRLHRFSQATMDRLQRGGLDPAYVANVVKMAITEDLAGGIDVTSTATVPARQRSRGVFGARQSGTIAGSCVAAGVIEMVCGEAASDWEYLVEDGGRVAPGDVVAKVEAPTRLLLTAERTALNLMCQMSGVATLTAQWADALRGTKARVRDTRKTVPGLRVLQKYAVRCGGGVNHRMSLNDAALVKDNHVLAAGGVAEAFAKVRSLESTIPVEIEVDSIAGLEEAISAGADVVMLDNFGVSQMRRAVARRDALNPKVILEASGGLTLRTARRVAETGVDYIAVGELTHSARVFDIGLDLQSVV